MEGKGIYSGAQQKEELDAFLRFGTPRSEGASCLTPVAELPAHYRKEIDRGFSTGWECLDKYIQGVRKGELTIITADTGVGKTTFCTQLVVNCAMQGVPAWINSWEMKPEVITRKLASIVLRSPMKMRPFTPQENHHFDIWARQYKLYINENTIGTDINALSSQLIRAKDLGIQVVMLDHLDYLVVNHKEKLHEAIDETVKKLHELAFSLSMHFLLICHPRQSVTNNEELGLHSLKGSSSIKQYADNVIILHRCSRTDPQSSPNKLKVRIAKNRMFGVEGATYLFYNPLWDGYEQLIARIDNEPGNRQGTGF